MAGHIEPGAIPYVNAVDGMPEVMLGVVADVAGVYKSRAATIQKSGMGAVTTWTLMHECYSGPGQDMVWTGMLPVGPVTHDLGADLIKVGEALEAFVEEARPILIALLNLQTAAAALVDDINNFQPYTDHRWGEAAMTAPLYAPFGAGGLIADFGAAAVGSKVESWDQDTDLTNRNNALMAEMSKLKALYEQAERNCANRINALYGGIHWDAAEKAASPETAYGHDSPYYDSHPGSWGATVERQESCTDRTTHFSADFCSGATRTAIGVVGGLGGLAAGLVGLSATPAGVIDGQSGWGLGNWRLHWDWRTMAQTWEGVVDLAAVVSAGPLAPLVPIQTHDFFTGESGTTYGYQVMGELGKSLVAWDEWGKSPGTALGMAAVNIGTFFIPGVAGAKGAEAGADGARVMRNSAKGFSVGERGALTGKVIDDIPNASRAATYEGLGNVGKLADDLPTGRIRLPDVPNVKANLGWDTRPGALKSPDRLLPETPVEAAPRPGPTRSEPLTPADAQRGAGTTSRPFASDGPLPESLQQAARQSQYAGEFLGDTPTDLAGKVNALNKGLAFSGKAPVTMEDLTAANLERTMNRLSEDAADTPGLIDMVKDVENMATEHIAGQGVVRDVGEAFGDTAGHEVMKQGDQVPLITDASPGSGRVDQVWVTKDYSQLTIVEAKGPSAGYGTRDVTLPDGTVVKAQQGSTAYTWDMLRQDPRILQAVSEHPELLEGLQNGTTEIRVVKVQPDAAGYPKVTDLPVDQGKLDIPGWLGGG